MNHCIPGSKIPYRHLVEQPFSNLKDSEKFVRKMGNLWFQIKNEKILGGDSKIRKWENTDPIPHLLCSYSNGPTISSERLWSNDLTSISNLVVMLLSAASLLYRQGVATMSFKARYTILQKVSFRLKKKRDRDESLRILDWSRVGFVLRKEFHNFILFYTILWDHFFYIVATSDRNNSVNFSC